MELMTAGEPGFDTETAGFQTGRRHRPEAIVPARDAEDVRAAVADAAARGVPVAVQNTGHGLTVAAEDGVLITTGRMDGVRIDPDARTARVEAGTRWRDVVAAAARHGLAPRSGSSPGVGVVGYTLGGGLGLMGRTFGWAADHVRDVDVVIADGRLRTVRPGDELHAGLLGGGGNLGVVTAMEFDLVPLTRLYGGGLYFDTELIPDVLGTWLEWTAGVEEDVSSSVGMLPFPDVDGVPAPLRGKHAVHVRIAFAGDPAAGERLVAPLRAIGPRLIDSVGELPWTEAHTIHSEPDFPHSYRSSNALLRDVGGDAAEAAVGIAGPGAPVMCVTTMVHLGGAFARRSARPNVVGHRDAAYLLGVLSPLDGDEETAAGVHGSLMDAVAPRTLGSFLSQVYRPTTPDEVRAGYDPDGWELLTRLNAEHDPDNLFRHNHNVRPDPGL